MSVAHMLRGRRAELDSAIAEAGDRRVRRRLAALLLVADGYGVTHAADALGVTRQTVYNWLHRYCRDARPEALADRPRPGRPRKFGPADCNWLCCVMERGPSRYGYDAPEWTVRLLMDVIRRERRADIAPRTLRRTLRWLGYRWDGRRFRRNGAGEP